MTVRERIRKYDLNRRIIEIRRQQRELEKRYNHNHDPKTGRFTGGNGLTATNSRGIINNDRNVNGQRRNRQYILTDEDIAHIQKEAEAIGIPIEILRFNEGNQTGFSDFDEVINIKGDVFPDEKSEYNRDRLSVRAVLAHEYYGHYKAHPSKYSVGDWRDEFNASYNAAKHAPNLSNEDRARLMIDAYDRAKEAGFPKEYDAEARRLIYGN